MKRQEHVAEVEEVAIRVRVENLKNGRYLGTSPDVPGIGGRRPQRCRNGRNRSRPRQKNRGILPGTRRSTPTCVPEQGSVEARIPRSCFCLLNGTPLRISLQGSCPPSQSVWFPIRPSRCQQP